jgi:translation elongation factor EF-G
VPPQDAVADRRVLSGHLRARPSRTRACSRMLDAVVDYLPSPLDIGRRRAWSYGDRRSRDRASRVRRRAALGSSRSRSWTTRSWARSPSVRVYSGQAIETGRSGLLNSTRDKKRAHRPHAVDALEQPRRRSEEAVRRRHRTPWPASRTPRTGDTLCDQAKSPVILESMNVPRAGHRDRDRAEVEVRPGKAGRRDGQEAGRRGSVLHRRHSTRSRVRPIMKRHGRASPRHQGRHP